MTTKQLVIDLKAKGEDFEFYPTTNEIIFQVNSKLKNYNSILDIGAGNGKVLKAIRKEHSCIDTYAIEKSQTLLSSLPDYVFVIGTDFLQQTLIDKKVDAVFCNPPYKEYDEWALRIVKEANTQIMFLVLPQRWKGNKEILETIEKRSLQYEILGSYDFENSEDRQARAKVDLIYISSKYTWNNSPDDPFDQWFEDNFKIEVSKEGKSDYELDREKAQELKGSLVKGDSLVKVLVELYSKDMEKLLKMYKDFESFDSVFLKELGVTVGAVKEGLKKRIQGLKLLYWKELFSNLDKITNHLTVKSREDMLKKLVENTAVEFSCENIYAVIIWVLKNANKYFDSQLIELFDNFTTVENIKNYVSNKRIPKSDWRYLWEKDYHSHYKLDYRIVWSAWKTFSGYDYEKVNGLNKKAADTLNDICTIAENLGFETMSRADSFNWVRGKKYEFLYQSGEVFMQVRAYENGNIHIKMEKKFLMAFNIEAGRLKKWLKETDDAVVELEADESQVAEHFRSNLIIHKSQVRMLTN